MKPLTRLKVLSAVLGGTAVAGMAVLTAPTGTGPPAPPGQHTRLVLAPQTEEMTEGESAEVTTTSTILSFRPTVTASIPPPPD